MKNNIIILVLTSLLVFTLVGYCKKIKEVNNLQETTQLKSQEYKIRINKKGIKIAEQEQLILTQKQALNNNLIKDKKVNTKVEIKTVTKIEKIYVPYIDTIRDTIVKDSIGIYPRIAKSSLNGFLDASMTVSDTGVTIDSLKVFNEMTVKLTRKRVGLFKIKPIISVENTNPYLQITGLNNVIIENKKRFYERPIFLIGTGFITGFIANSFVK